MDKQLAGNIIGEGTHGTIIIDENDSNMVVKIYKKVTAKHCENLQNEYELQKMIYEQLLHIQNTNHILSTIVVPYSCCYKESNTSCSYTMERIFPLDGNTKYYIINMAEPNINSKFSHSKIADQIGYNILNRIYGVDTLTLAYNIGLFYSYLHYILHIDGYDCELIYGNIKSFSKFILVDYDKSQKFKIESGFISYRKFDENTIVKKVLQSPKQFATYLFVALISMSLLPTEPIHKNEFIRGYKYYMINKNNFSREVQNNILELITDYEL